MDTLYVLAALGALLWLQLVITRRFAMRGLRYTRTFSRKAAFCGESVEMVEVIRNAKLLPLPWLRAESRMSPHLRFSGAVADEGLHEIEETALFHRSVFFLGPYVQVTRRHTVSLEKRGRYAVGSVALTAGDLFGLMTQTQQLETGAAISVYPRLLSMQELQQLSSRWQGDLIVRRWIAPDPFLLAGIREWQTGDARRDIHWAATARTGRLQVKMHDYSSDPKLFVILNIQMMENQWGDLMEYEQALIEQGISMQATLCLRALAGGVEAGIAVNAPSGEADAEPTVMLPARYAGRDEDILEALARLRIHRARSFPTFLDGFDRMTGLDIVILSAYDSERIRQRIAKLRLAGNSVVFELLQEAIAP